MKPFLEYGWQPQVMIVDGAHKAIRAGAREEIYDVIADSAEARDLAGATALVPATRAALWDYPLPSPDQARAPEALTDEARRKLATLGYVSAGAAPVVRKDAPRPADMTRLFGALEQASALFVSEQYAQVIPLLEKILAGDPHNLDAALRLATAHSALGHDARALEAFKTADAIAPDSADVRTYLALHYAKGKNWPQAVPLLERLYAESPNRLPVIEALATVRERQNRPADAVALRQQVFRLRPPTGDELVRVGMLDMQIGRTPEATDAFEQARKMQGASFTHDLELGVLYLAARRFTDARDALDRVPASHPDYPMALFKRAQVSVLLNEPDRVARIDAAKQKADATTRPLIASEKLFQNIRN
jgi:tetratricopeptide (TPR) repeat protein